MKYEFEDDDESYPMINGWVARRWDPAVRERLAKLLFALTEQFDGQIAGLNLAETPIGFGASRELHPAGFSYDTYFEGIKDLMSSARRAFRESDVIVYANFMLGEELPIAATSAACTNMRIGSGLASVVRTSSPIGGSSGRTVCRSSHTVRRGL